MFVTPKMILIAVVIQFCAGGLIGFAVLKVMRRFLLRPKTVLLGAIFAGVVFIICCGVGGWADEHAEFVNGKRVAFASWGEDLRVRNFLAENTYILAATGSTFAAMLVGLVSQRSMPPSR